MKHEDPGFQQHYEQHIKRIILVKWCRHCEQIGYRLGNTEPPKSQTEMTHWRRKR